MTSRAALLAVSFALLTITPARPAHADLWAGTGRNLTEREKWQYEFAAADVILLAHVMDVRDGIVDSVRTARAQATAGNSPSSRIPIDNMPFLRAGARLQPLACLKGTFAGKEIHAYHRYGGLAPPPHLAPLRLAAGADTLAIVAFLNRDSLDFAFDDDHYVFPAGCVVVGQSHWQPLLDQAKQWNAEMRVDSLVARADVVAHPSAVMFGPAGCSLDLGKVIKGRAGFVVPVRPFLFEDYRNLPAYVCLSRGTDGVFEPIPEWWGLHGLYAPANSDSLAVVNAVERQAMGGPSRSAERK